MLTINILRGTVAGLLAVTSLYGLEVPVKSGDFDTFLASKSDELNIWRMLETRIFNIFDFPNLTSREDINRITQLTEQYNEPYSAY